ncbi:phospholipid-transporting ATPase ABCA3-like [Diceros bicornis minor]|uniref:phospholipid-transporting ATPase ABCA3-like n=1 Tax=Diceros bicornis minor TaxID=77932 RepID=UPI0026F29ED3|nr:phospholipid-transporting ATPase ABCA3-like [Diceros bicornis minor]
MDLLGFNQFMVLLWKNLILKRRQFIALIVEIILTLLFAGTLLLTRKFMVIKNYGPFNYSLQPLDELPAFLGTPVPFPGLWELAFVPSKSIVVKDIVESVKRDLYYNFKVQGFSSERDFEDYVKQENNSKKVMVAFVFDHEFKNSHDPLPLKVKYYLRFSSFQRNKYVGFFRPRGWETGTLFPTVPSVGPRNEHNSNGGSPGYITEGFLVMQHALDKAIMKYHNHIAAQKLFKDVSVFVQRFPYPIYYHDYFFTFFNVFIPLVILFIFSMNHLILIQSVVWEKENRLKEYQLMIGLSNWMLWAAYFFTFLFLYSVIIFLMCLIFFAKIEPVPVIQHSDPSLVFVFLLCFAIATIFFSFMVSTFFNKVHFAVPVGGFIYLATYFPATRVSSNYAHMTLTQKLASCLSSNVAMALGTKFLVKAEMDSIGIKWSNIFSPTEMDNFVFAHVLGMFLVDAFLYGLVAWYIEAVFPGEYGVPKPWNFFLLRSHWFGEIPEKKNETRQFYEIIESKYFEAEPTDLVAGIRVKHLCKEFRVQNTTKMAVKDLSLNLYEGQITVLLGHNGAGKSTTLSLLSGLYPSTSGEAYVNGYDISKHMVQIRKSLGLCPQQDLLFNYLTVSEHLYFYCVLKGIPPEMRRMEIDRMLSAFNLLEKRDALSQSLSGGMKRRLSIIIALIGGSKVVILDEPTSGMDPASRRATWSLLQHYKQDRTILLTTHYMDEADVLGDRIAIMVKGSLRCCGSSVFLKKIYGVGYHIVMVKEPHCDVEEISKLINYYIPTATLEKNFRNELSFILPKEYTHRFEALFTNLEKRQKELGIASFGASITTMEEVFFRVSNTEDSQTDIQATQPQTSSLSEASVENQNVNMSRNERADSSTMNESPAIMFNTGYSLYQQQFRAMFIKRVMFSWRNWKLILLQILALLGSFTFLSAADKFSPNNEDEKARLMDLGQYGQTIVPLSISGNSNLTQIFLKHLKSMLVSEKQTLKEVQGDLLKYLIENEDCIHLCIVAFSIEVKRNEITFTALFNNQAYHSPSLTLAMLDNILFMSVSGPDASLTVSNKPQPHSRDNERSTMITNGHQVALNIHFGIALLISGFCLLTVTERVSKAKHIQFVSGVYVLVYWLSALLWDFIIFFITCCLLLVMFKYCQLDIYVTDYHFLDTMLIFMLFGWSTIPLMYLLSFLFTRSTSAYIKLVLFNYLSGIFSLLIDAAFQFEVPHSMSNATRTFIRNSLLLFPNYNLAKCIADYFTFYQKRKWCSVKIPPGYLNCSQDNTAKNIYSLEEEMIGKYMIMMSTTGFIFLLLLFFLETTLWKLRTFFNQYIYFGIYKTFRKEKVSKELSGESEDEDVQNERKRILGQSREQLNSTVLIKELTKIYFNYPIILAVKNISVTIQKGECFGLLGFNGAGKTTTFQILTGEESVTSGNVFIDGFSITENVQEVKSRIGYCPQSDALLEYMTGREIMIMYARLWGVSEPQIQLYVNKWLNSLQLEPHADKLIRTYSGGSKRRLSTAIALMGKPSVILLDEPSTGMDPVARRLLWDAVIRARESGKAVIITSHRMEECDAFCTKLAIMVQGKFMCLGSPQHLKNKFGNVYILKIKVKFETCEDKLNDLKFLITTTFPGSILKQVNQGILNYYIPSKDNSWGKVFGILEEVKEQFNLDDYSISQITLEQVFLTFANLQNTEDYKVKVP